MSPAAQTLPDGRLIAYYGDDFTGSTDVMEVLTFAGLPTVLFLDVPDKAQLDRFADYRAVGVAGTARSRSPGWMDENLPSVFRFLADLDAALVQYKVCSTFDSAPAVGSIGRAIDLALPVFGGAWSPLVVAAPALRRFQAFGNPFATVDGVGYRLDRHPTMAHHPVTPMAEADLCRHLAGQTDRAMGLVDFVQLKAGKGIDALQRELADGADIVAVDIVDEETLRAAGRLVWEARSEAPFTASSSGLEYALVAHWQETGALDPPPPPKRIGVVDNLLVVSGSCSPATASQIAWARTNMFRTIRLDVTRMDWDAAVAEARDAALAGLGNGDDVAVFSAEGSDDPSIAAMRQRPDDGNEHRIGAALGAILSAAVRAGAAPRAVVAGGDTSSHAMAQLDGYALTALAPVAPGSPLCRLHAEDPGFDGYEIALKGGQVGGPDYFGLVKRGGRHSG